MPFDKRAWSCEYYRKNQARFRRQRSKDNKKRYHARIESIRALKAERGCSRCPENDPDCLDFHHRDPTHKKFAIASSVAHYSLERVFEEIGKCDVLCANCHRKLEAALRRAKRAA